MTAADAHLAPGPAGWWRARRSGQTLLLAWSLSRAFVLAVFGLAERFVVGDVLYYHRKFAALGEAGLAGTLNEYPTPVVWILSVPYGLGLGNDVAYVVVFIAGLLALDGLFTYAVYVARGRVHDAAADFWLLFVVLVGPLTYLRFDLLPAVLAGGALLAARSRPWLTGALTGLGAAVKLWPALLIGAFLARRPDRAVTGAWFVGVGFGLAAVSLVTGGWTRLVSPLVWQADRGLQIESVWATPVMVARALQPDVWTVQTSRYQAFEIFGPAVDGFLTVSTVATVVGLAVVGALLFRAFRHPEPSPIAIGLVVLATVAIMVISNKTLSPQYLLWLGGPMAALLVASADASSGPRGLIRRLAAQLLVLALLIQLVYPLLYDALLGYLGAPLLAVATVVTAVRNLALLAFTVEVCLVAWAALAKPHPTS